MWPPPDTMGGAFEGRPGPHRFPVAAAGDSLNDLSLLKSCDYPVLFRPVEALRLQFPNAPLAVNLDEALAFFDTAWRESERNGA